MVVVYGVLIWSVLMDVNVKQKFCDFLKEILEQYGDYQGFFDVEVLFLSGRFDLFLMMNFVMFLEEVFCFDFFDFEFDVVLVDLVDVFEKLIDFKLVV